VIDKDVSFILFCTIRYEGNPVVDALVQATLYNKTGAIETVDGIHVGNGVYAFDFSDTETKYGFVLVRTLNYVGEAFCEVMRSDAYPQALLSRKIVGNNWEIKDNQLIIYDDDGETPLLVFDLYDRLGNPAEVNVFKRVKKE